MESQVDSRGVKVKFFAGVRDLFGEKEVEVDLDAALDIERLLATICDSPERRRGLLDGPGVLKKDIVILINGRSIAFLGALKAPLQEGDVVSVFPPLYGG